LTLNREAMSRYLLIGAVIAVIIVAVAGGLFFVTSQQGRVVGSSSSLAPTTARAPIVNPLPTDAPNATSTVPLAAPSTAVATAVRPATPTARPRPPAATLQAATTQSQAEPAKVAPVQVSASNSAPDSQDARGNITTFLPENTIDGQLETAWRVPGDGVSQWLLLEFAQPVELSTVRILPGYAKVDVDDGTNRFLQNRRVRRVRLEFSAGPAVEATLEDEPAVQGIPVSGVRTSFVRIVILESLPPALADGRDFTPISEVEVEGLLP
jgi:hypothetical protein